MTCSDPENRDFVLSVTGQVRSYANIRPMRIRYSVKLNEPVFKTVDITPDKEYPFKVVSASLRKNTDIPCELENTENRYRVKIQCPSDKPGNFRDTIVIKTDSKKLPEIRIPVSGYVIEPKGKK